LYFVSVEFIALRDKKVVGGVFVFFVRRFSWYLQKRKVETPITYMLHRVYCSDSRRIYVIYYMYEASNLLRYTDSVGALLAWSMNNMVQALT
jgi:hypothetical protein